MPDWICHLAIGAGMGSAFRIRNLRLLLLGALLPDVNILAGVFCESHLLGLEPSVFLPLVLPLFSPFAVFCYCLAISFWMDKPFRAFGLLLTGAVTHIAADMLQVGHVEMIFFPFSVKLFIGSLVHYGGKPYIWLAAMVALLLVALRFFPQQIDILVTRRRGWLSLLPLVLLAVVILGSADRFKRENVYNYAFFCGKPVPAEELAVHVSCQVVKSRPLLIKDCGRIISVDWPFSIPEGKQITVWGHYGADGRLQAERIAIDNTTLKITLSIIGALIFLIYWIRIPFIDKKQPVF